MLAIDQIIIEIQLRSYMGWKSHIQVSHLFCFGKTRHI